MKWGLWDIDAGTVHETGDMAECVHETGDVAGAVHETSDVVGHRSFCA